MDVFVLDLTAFWVFPSYDGRCKSWPIVKPRNSNIVFVVASEESVNERNTALFFSFLYVVVSCDLHIPTSILAQEVVYVITNIY